ncbi:hypothetical protein EBR66_05890 [bacterium]|nr:hypothetical protein [bacterium]
MEDTSPEFHLGDGVYISGGRLDGTRGTIYYMDDTLIRILPLGVSDRLVEVPIVDGELDPKLGIVDFFQTSQRAVPAFVAQIDAHVGQKAETFDVDGKPGITYMIKEVNEREDTITLVDETGGERKIEFSFTGVPLDEPFAVLRPRQVEADVENAGQNAPEEELEDTNVFENIDDIVDTDKKKGLVERSVTQRIYPDIVQRNDMFQSLLELLDISAQKNQRNQKNIRKHVEQLLLLRNELVQYTPTGEPDGSVPTSFHSIAELLENTDIPLSRPVLETSRSLYLSKSEDQDTITELPGVAVDIQYMKDVLDESNEFLNTQLAGTSGQIVIPDALPQWFIGWETFFKRYMRSWLSEGDRGERIVFAGDKEFLRAPMSSGKDAIVDGLIPLGDYDATTSQVGKVRLSLLKGLAPRFIRLKEKDAPRKIESGDEAILTGQLLFPLHTQRDLGLSRSGRLMKDIAYSHFPGKTLLEILNIAGGIPDTASAGSIISIGEGGNTSGNIAIDEWLQVQPFRIRGLGDALIDMKNLGMTHKELTVEQQQILVNKIQQYRALLHQYITTERDISTKALTELRLENIPFLQGEALEDLVVTLESEPLIHTWLDDIRKRIPAYKENDLAIVAGISTKLPELLLTTLAGIPGPLARERNRCVRDQFLEALDHALRKGLKKANIGEIPQPIVCPHMDSINEIRKVKDTDDRMQLMARFLARFRGVTKNNWILCSASASNHPHNLICYHEFLQLQEYLHPREKDTIHKEILLTFSCGVFQGKFMCKNCGQPISEIDFDRSMEFDDNGKPMANRAALIDMTEDENQINMLLGSPTEEQGEGAFSSDRQKIIYTSTRQLFDKVGIYANIHTFQNIVERVESDIQKQPSREEYSKIIKAKKGEKKFLDYDILINRLLVTAIGAHSLIEIQTHVPDFILRYKIPGCVAGFSGYPIGREEDMTGINYISCAISSIKSNEPPWSLSGFLTISQDKKRQEIIAEGIKKLVADGMKTAIVQQMLSIKRAHNEKVYGRGHTGVGIPERVPVGFRPIPYYTSVKEATEAIVVPEAASNEELIRGWIQMGHKIARENGVYVRGSPFSETSCCYTPIGEPRTFWSKKEETLPKLPARTPPKGQSNSQVMLRFIPRPPVKLLADPPEDLFYRVFLRVCYDGPQKGLPHESGYTNTCIHCGFVFPENPYTVNAAPPLSTGLYKEWKSEMDAIITKGKTALDSQRVVVNKGTFENILDATHTRFHIELPKSIKPISGTAIFGKLMKLEPEPFEGCRLLLAEILTRVSRFTPTPSEIEIAEAYEPLSENKNMLLIDIQKRIGAPSVKTLQTLLKQSPTQIVEYVRTYFLIPFQRLINRFKPNSLQVQKTYDLPRQTADDVNRAIEQHLDYLNSLQKNIKGYTEIKLKQAQKQLSTLLLTIQQTIRSTLIPGGELGTSYLVTSLIVGILGEFINPNIIPDGVSGTGGTVEQNARVPLNILEVCLSRLELEGLNFTEEQIRDMIARRTAAEKDLFTTNQNKMTPEEKKGDMMMKRLGLGKWSIGGTKAVYTLDADQYDREREQRIQMGLADFTADPAAIAHANALLQEDAFGGGAEEGYDTQQMAADDY